MRRRDGFSTSVNDGYRAGGLNSCFNGRKVDPRLKLMLLAVLVVLIMIVMGVVPGRWRVVVAISWACLGGSHRASW